MINNLVRRSQLSGRAAPSFDAAFADVQTSWLATGLCATMSHESRFDGAGTLGCTLKAVGSFESGAVLPSALHRVETQVALAKTAYNLVRLPKRI